MNPQLHNKINLKQRKKLNPFNIKINLKQRKKLNPFSIKPQTLIQEFIKSFKRIILWIIFLEVLKKGVTTHSCLATFGEHYSLVFSLEPLKVDEALDDPDWVMAMQEELNNFTRNEV
jgi:hypothetical protein